MMALSTLSPTPSRNSRWRSVLMTTRWSSRGGEKKQIDLLPTVMAAATEKVVVRQGRHSHYVHSQDLTAIEFASMAGIKIKENNDYNSEMPGYFCDDKLNERKETSIALPMARSSSNGSCSHYITRKGQQPQIWDSEFWHQHDDDAENKVRSASSLVTVSWSPSLSTSPSCASTSSTYSEQSVSTLRPPSLVRSSGPSVILKGRFKIVLGNDDDDTKPVEPQYVEWRRKRACTN